MFNASKKYAASWFHAALEEPYRIFFPLGIFWGAVGITHWLFYALHWIPAYSMQLHSAIQMQAYMGCFIVGFLLTAMPRFASAQPPSRFEFSAFFFLVNAAPYFYLRQDWASARLCFTAWLLMLAFFAGRRFLSKKKSDVLPPIEFVWIPAALLNGLAGVILMTGAEIHYFPSMAQRVGKLLAEQGFLLNIVLGVGSFLGPRLMGTFQPSFQAIKDIKIRRQKRNAALFLQLAAAACLCVTFYWEGVGNFFPAYFLRAFVIGLIYFRSKTLVLKPLVQDPYAQWLWLSFWMVFLGYAGLPFFPAYRSAFLHVVFLGGYAVMTFAVATMVIFSHGGESAGLQKKHWQFPVMGIFLGSALFLRVTAVYFPSSFFHLLAGASIAWLLTAILWLFFTAPLLFKSLTKEEFERCHDEAKERVAVLKSGQSLGPKK